MPHYFDTITDRTPTQSIKWQRYAPDVLPMWVADMDFRSPEPVVQALQKHISHGIFGYEQAPPALKEVIVARLKHLYAWEVAPEAIIFLPGVVPAFNMAVQEFVEPDSAVLIQTPVYPPILHTAKTAGVRSQAMSLTRNVAGGYTIDFDIFAAKVADAQLFLLCNPHNPVGRVFTEVELTQMADLCLQNDVLICSDEIHGDLIFKDHQHRPIAALAPEVAARTITLMAPSKTFNIAGLNTAFAIVPDADVRQRFHAARRGILGHVNALGYTAALAAYQHGQAWLDTALHYLEANCDFLLDYANKNLPGIHITKPEGTYLAWLDCRGANIPGNPHDFFVNQAQVALNAGATFGADGTGFVRLNFGCPRAILNEGLERMRNALQTLS